VTGKYLETKNSLVDPLEIHFNRKRNEKYGILDLKQDSLIMPNTRNDTAAASLNPTICTWPNLQMLILNLQGPACSIRAKDVFLGAEGRAK